MANVTSPRRKPTKAAEKTTEPTRKRYTVKADDNIDAAAEALGITREQVISRNNLRHDLLFEGQVLHS